LREREIPISLALREYVQGYPIYYGYKGDETFLRILELLLDETGVHSVEIDNPYQGHFLDDHIPIKTKHMRLAGERYGDRVLTHLRLGPDIPDINYYLKHMENTRKTAVGLFTSLDYGKIGYGSQEEQLEDIETGIRMLRESGVETVRFSVENGVYYFKNGERENIEELIEAAIKAGANTIGLPKTNGTNSIDMFKFGQEVTKIIPNGINIRIHCHGRNPYSYTLDWVSGLFSTGHYNVTVETTLERSMHPDSVEIPGIVEMNHRLLGLGAINRINHELLENRVQECVDLIYRPSHLPPYEMAIGTHAAKSRKRSEDYDGHIVEENPERVLSHTTGKHALEWLLEIYGIELDTETISRLSTEIRGIMSGDYSDIDPLKLLDNGIPDIGKILEKIRNLLEIEVL